MNGFEFCKLLRRQPIKNRAGWKMAQEKQREKVVPTREKAVILSSKNNKTTKKNSWVNKDLTKSPKKKRFEQNGAV